jgi:hypothetical protein
MNQNWSLSVKVDYYLADKVARVHFIRPFVQCLISMGLTEEEYLQEVTNGNNVPEFNQQAAVSPSTSCQLLIFTVTRSQIHPLSTRPKPAASKRGRPKATASVITSSPFRKNPADSWNRGASTKPRALFPVKNKKTNLTSEASTAVQAKRRKPKQSPEEADEDYAECIFCAGKFSGDRSGEQWIKWLQCLD